MTSTDSPLAGGNLNLVLKRGDAVIRPAGPWSPTIQRLLQHVRARGLSWVPEPRGFDADGKEVLGFIEGEVAHGQPSWLWAESVLNAAAAALRQWHDASADFDRRGAIWQGRPRTPREVICHSDFAPYNCVFRNAQFVGLIDFDFCLPAPRLWDIAYSAYRFVPLMPAADQPVVHPADERAPFLWPEQRERLGRFLEAYAAGVPALHHSSGSVLAAVATRLRHLARFSDAAAVRLQRAELSAHASMYRRHAAWLRQQVMQPGAT